MKTKLAIVAGMIVAFIAVFVSAEAQENTTIKVLPTTKEGIVKLLVVGAGQEPISVRFFNEDGFVEEDVITTSLVSFDKKYDVRKIMNEDFSMIVVSSGTKLTYKLAKSGSNLTPFLYKSEQTFPLISAKKQ